MNNYTTYDVWYDDYEMDWNPFPSHKWFAAFYGETFVQCREFDSEAATWDWVMDIATEL